MRITQVDQVLVDSGTGEVLDNHLVFFPPKIKAEALILRANASGAIKTKIKQAITLLSQ